MAHNPLLGSRISLISKKNIRYEGTLYSINEQDATVALQNVRAYGTEGRESESETFVPPQDTIHPYLLFRGCDIKDLHVHENQQQQQADNDIPEDPAIVSSEQPNSSSGGGGDEVAKQEETEKSTAATTSEERTKTSTEEPDESAKDKSAQEDNQGTTTENDEVARDQNENNSNRNNQTRPQAKSESNADESEPLSKSNKPNRSSNNRRKKNTNPKKMVGSGASLLNRKVRGVVDGDNGPENANEKNFDFESNLAEFSKTNDDVEEDDDVDEDENAAAYNKDDFFDSISCDVSDRQNGIDNRLRGREERSLNTETFGATSLGYGGRRGNNRRYRGGGRGRGSMPRENNRWKEGLSHGGGRHGDRKTYGDGGLSANRNAGAQ